MREIHDYPLYTIDEHGTIIRKAHVNYYVSSQSSKALLHRFRKERKIKCFTNRDGYLETHVVNEHGQKKVRVHTLVLMTYKGKPPQKGMICRHLDGVRTNNHPDNLEWGTPAENNADMVKHGNQKKSALTRAEVAYIQNANETQKVLAKEFGISQSYVQLLRTGWEPQAYEEDL